MTTTFYQYTKFLDRLKTIASPSWDEVDQVLSLIKDTPYFRYFFYDLNNPGWLPPLKDVGIFHNPPEPTEAEKGLFRIPPWEASRYLIRVAHVYPGLVAEIALQIETENFRVHQDLVQAAMRMPPAIAAQMMPPVIRWLDSRFKGLVPEYAGDLMVYLAEGGQWEAALRLLQALTEPTIEQPSEGENERLPRLARSQAQPRYDKYILEQILEKHIPQLARTHPLRVLAILEAQLIGAIELEQEVGQWRQSADGSIFWRSAIEDHPQNSGLREMKELLAEAIRDILQEVATDEHVRSVIKRYLTHQYSIFRRLAIHMVRLQPEHYQDLVGRLFGDRANLDDPNIHHEFYLLMGAAFDKAPPEVQEHLLQWIVEGEPPERLEQSKESYIDRTGEEPPEDLVRRWKENWTWTRLWALRNYDLPPKYRSELDRLVVELGEPEHPSFLMYSTSWVGPTGPKSKDELVTMTPAEVLKYLKGYTPSQEPFAPSPEGLGRVLQTVIQEKVEEYASCAPRFLEPGVQPAYMYYLLWGLEEAWKAGRSFDWEPVLTFCEDVVQRTDEEQEGQSRTSFETSYAAVHGQAATLLQEAVRRDDHAIPQEHMLRVRDILLRLLHHPDPTPEHEQQYGGDNMDPATLSLNTVRGKAMHALIVYALRRARFIEGQAQAEERDAEAQRLESEVREALTHKLDKTRDPSPAVHSIFGQYLSNLYYLDHEWLIKHLSAIFPREAEKRVYWRAAWNAYISFNRLYSDLYRLLRVEYRRAVEQLSEKTEGRAGFERANESLAEHLMIAYWRGLEEVEGDESLLPLFYERASDVVRAHATWFLWQVLAGADWSAAPQKWQRLRRLWETRAHVANQAQDPSAFSQELSAFSWWLSIAPEGLDSLYPLVEAIVPHLEKHAHTGEVMEYLATQAEAHPGLAARLLLEIIKLEKWAAYRDPEETEIILTAAMKSGDDKARSHAEVAINLLGERGEYRYRKLLEL